MKVYKKQDARKDCTSVSCFQTVKWQENKRDCIPVIKRNFCPKGRGTVAQCYQGFLWRGRIQQLPEPCDQLLVKYTVKYEKMRPYAYVQPWTSVRWLLTLSGSRHKKPESPVDTVYRASWAGDFICPCPAGKVDRNCPDSVYYVEPERGEKAVWRSAVIRYPFMRISAMVWKEKWRINIMTCDIILARIDQYKKAYAENRRMSGMIFCAY